MVLKTKINSLPLLGRPSLDELGMLKIDETGGLKEPNKAVKKIENENPELEKILDRYPEVEFVYSTAIKPVRKKLKKVFATHGVPKTVQSDNGPPFNSEDFKEFAAEMGFTHKKITPQHPKAQGQVEGFNKLMNKTAAIAR